MAFVLSVHLGLSFSQSQSQCMSHCEQRVTSKLISSRQEALGGGRHVFTVNYLHGCNPEATGNCTCPKSAMFKVLGTPFLMSETSKHGTGHIGWRILHPNFTPAIAWSTSSRSLLTLSSAKAMSVFSFPFYSSAKKFVSTVQSLSQYINLLWRQHNPRIPRFQSPFFFFFLSWLFYVST